MGPTALATVYVGAHQGRYCGAQLGCLETAGRGEAEACAQARPTPSTARSAALTTAPPARPCVAARLPLPADRSCYLPTDRRASTRCGSAAKTRLAPLPAKPGSSVRHRVPSVWPGAAAAAAAAQRATLADSARSAPRSPSPMPQLRGHRAGRRRRPQLA